MQAMVNHSTSAVTLNSVGWKPAKLCCVSWMDPRNCKYPSPFPLTRPRLANHRFAQTGTRLGGTDATAKWNSFRSDRRFDGGFGFQGPVRRDHIPIEGQIRTRRTLGWFFMGKRHCGGDKGVSSNTRQCFFTSFIFTWNNNTIQKNSFHQPPRNPSLQFICTRQRARAMSWRQITSSRFSPHKTKRLMPKSIFWWIMDRFGTNDAIPVQARIPTWGLGDVQV